MTDNKDWQKEYYSLLDKQEMDERSSRETEALLCRTIIRLTAVASGIDTELDDCLETVRRDVRDGVKPSLQSNLTQLSDLLIRLDREAESAEPPATPACNRLIERSGLNGKKASRAEAICQRYFVDQSQVSDKELDELLAAFGGVRPESGSESTSQPGLLKRLFGEGKADSGAADATSSELGKVNTVLKDLLAKLKWPKQWMQDIESYCLHLTESKQSDEWKRVITSIAELAYHSFGAAQTELDEAEDFLEDLTKRLSELDQHLLENQTNRAATLEHGRLLNENVSGQVDGIQSGMQQTADLQQLKQLVYERLDQIQAHVSDFYREEEGRFKKSEESDHQLKMRLSELEQETQQLRARMLEAHHMALQDAVTGLPNRAAYDERVEQEFIRWKRFAEPLSMLVWDIDDFKSVNDRFGHQAGDKALRVIAKILKERLRESDFIARYGGEEFVCLLCGTEPEAARKVAEEMRQSVADSGFHAGGKAVVLTSSCGISSFRDDDDPAKVFARADKALYQAKRSGKNRCEVL